MHDAQFTIILHALAVMSSGGPQARSRDISTYRRIHLHEPHTQCAASEGRNVRVQSFARGGCGLQAQSAESTGCHVERRAAGPQSRHPNVPEFLPLRFAWVHACSTLGTPRQARGDKKTHVFCYKSGKMYYLWDKRSAGKARFALPLRKREKFTSLTVTGGCPRTGSCNHAPKGGSTLTALYPDGRGPLVL